MLQTRARRHPRGALVTLQVLMPVIAYHGETTQHRPASVLVAADGTVARIRIGYDAPCTDPRYRFPNVFRFEPPFETATPTDIVETVKVSTRLKGGGRNRQTARVTAHFD